MKMTGGSIRTFFYHRAMYMWTLRICTQILLIFTHFRCLYQLTNYIKINATSPFFEDKQSFKQGYRPAFYNPTICIEIFCDFVLPIICVLLKGKNEFLIDFHHMCYDIKRFFFLIFLKKYRQKVGTELNKSFHMHDVIFCIHLWWKTVGMHRKKTARRSQ